MEIVFSWLCYFVPCFFQVRVLVDTKNIYSWCSNRSWGAVRTFSPVGNESKVIWRVFALLWARARDRRKTKHPPLGGKGWLNRLSGKRNEEINKRMFVQRMKITLDSDFMSPLFVLHFRHHCDNNKNSLGFFPTTPLKIIFKSVFIYNYLLLKKY